MNKILSIFVDESGDFGEYEYHSPFYIVSIVHHEQDLDINNNITEFEKQLSSIGFPRHCIHSGPIIRGENDYRNTNIEVRKMLLKKIAAFVRNTDIKFKSFYIEKKHIQSDVEIVEKISKQISYFIKEHFSYYLQFDKIIVYYDNGQIQLNKILVSIFSVLFDHVEFRKVIPADYRLFQVADYICTIKLLQIKFLNNSMSKSEKYFFGDMKTFKKQYLKKLLTKEIND